MSTLRSLAVEWVSGTISLSEAITRTQFLDFPTPQNADDGNWFEGEQDNTLESVQALIGTDLTQEQYYEFSNAFAEYWS